MASFTISQLEELTKMVSGAFYYNMSDAVKAQGIWFPQFLMEETTDQYTANFSFLRSLSRSVEGKRKQPPVYRNQLGDKAVISLRQWNDGIRADMLEVAADRFGQVLRDAQNIASREYRKPQDLICDIFNLGNTSAYLLYDGQNYYDNAHPKGGTTFDNLLAGALSLTTFQATRTASRRFPSDAGAAFPLDILPTHLWVPPDLEYTANELMKNAWRFDATATAGTTENVIKGMCEVISDALLTDTNDWGLVANTSFVKPFVKIKHSVYGDPVLYENNDANSDAIRNREDFEWWFRYYMTTYPTRPEFGIKVVN